MPRIPDIFDECPKCGDTLEKGCIWYKGFLILECSYDCPGDEHLHILCLSCNYWWQVPPLDSRQESSISSLWPTVD